MSTNEQSMKDQLEQIYRAIHTERMTGLPILNPKLDVTATGFDLYEDYYVGILLTPWFMNLMLIPVHQPTQEQIGTTRTLSLPAGEFDCIAGHEQALGYFYNCSLFSPVFEFADHETAVLTAEAAYEEVMKLPETVTSATPNDPPQMSRRNLLRGQMRESG